MDSDVLFFFGYFILGFFIGTIFIFAIGSDKYTLDKILQYQTDCKVKEFYYMDEHRQLCDKIGVIP